MSSIQLDIDNQINSTSNQSSNRTSQTISNLNQTSSIYNNPTSIHYYSNETTAKPPPNTTDDLDDDSSLLIIVCVSVLSVLFIACLCALYSCCKKYIWSSQIILAYTGSTYHYNDQSNATNYTKNTNQLSPSTPPTIPTIQNAVDQSLSVGSAPRQQAHHNQSAHRLADESISSRIARTRSRHQLTNRKSNIHARDSSSDLNRIKPRSHKKASSFMLKTNRLSNLSAQEPVLISKTADMFKPKVDTTSKKEFVLFKAPSFNDK